MIYNICDPEEVVVGSVGFPDGTRNLTGESADRSLDFDEDQCAHGVFERISVAAIGDGWFEHCKGLFKLRGRRVTPNTVRKHQDARGTAVRCHYLLLAAPSSTVEKSYQAEYRRSNCKLYSKIFNMMKENI